MQGVCGEANRGNNGPPSPLSGLTALPLSRYAPKADLSSGEQMRRGIRWILSFCLVAICAPAGRTQSQDQTKQLSREIFKQLIEINTTDSVGNVTTAAEAMARRLRDGGFRGRDKSSRAERTEKESRR